MPFKVKVISKHQIAVPSAIRKELQLNPDDRLLAQVRDGVIVLVPDRGDAVDQSHGLYRDLWHDVDAQAFVNQERVAWETA